MEKDLVEITIGQDLPHEKRRLKIWVQKEDKFLFDAIHRTTVVYEAEKQGKELARKIISDSVFKFLGI